MRVTQNMLSQTALDGMQTNLLRLSEVQRKAVTTKRINRPEDDPFAVEQSLGFRNRIKTGESTLRNVALSQDWLNATDKTLSDMIDLTTRARSLAIQGSNDANGVEERESIAIEVDGMLEQAVSIANSRHGEHFLFSGYRIDQTPFEVTRDPVTNSITAVNYAGDDGLMQREAEPGTNISINIPGRPLFTAVYDSNGDSTADSGIFDALIRLRDNLRTNPSQITAGISEIKANANELLNIQAAVGTKVRRLETTASRVEDLQTGLSKLLSDAEDADMTQVITELNQRQYVYQSALNVNARVINTSLLDFLR